MVDKHNIDVNTLTIIHLGGAATYGFVSLIVWLMNRGKNNAMATQAFVSLMWNVAYLLIMMFFLILYLTALIAYLATGSLGDHEDIAFMLIGMIWPSFWTAINIGLAFIAVRKARKGVQFPYLLPPAEMAKRICQRFGTNIIHSGVNHNDR